MKRSLPSSPRIDGTTSTNAKVEAIVRYLAAAPAADAAWAVFFLTGRRLKRLLPYRAISAWTMALAGVEEWLLGECYSVVGDGAETATLILDQIPNDSGVVLPGGTTPESLGLAEWVEGRILPLRQASPEAQQRQVIGWIRELGRWERFTLFKLLTGELRTRRVADAGGAGAGAGGRAAGDVRRRAAHGRVDAVGGVVRRAGVARRHRRGPIAAVPVLPRLADRQRDHRRAGHRGAARRARATGWSSGSGTASAPS